MKVVFMAAMVAVVALLVVACGGSSSSSSMPMGADGMNTATVPPGAVAVNLSNWTVAPAKTELMAGKVTFAANHLMDHGMNAAADGGATHELLVAAEDAPGSGKFSNVLLKLQDIKPGESKTGVVDLKPGTYELSCQVGEVVQGKAVSHYAKGMRTTITVK